MEHPQELSQIEHWSDGEWIDPVMVELAKQMFDPPGNDIRISKFCQAVLEISHNKNIPEQQRPYIKPGIDLILESVNANHDQPSYGVNKILRCFMKQFMFRGLGQDFPKSYDKVEPWREGIIAVVTSETHFDEVIDDIVSRETQSNVVQRYSSLKLLIQLYGERHRDPAQVLDIGCSQNLGLKKIARATPFETVKVAELTSLNRYKFSPLRGRQFNGILNNTVTLGQSVGVDIFNVQDKRNIEWVRANSNYPTELLNKRRLQEAFELGEAIVPTVGFIQADIVSDKIDGKYRTNQSQTQVPLFDIVFASTSMYQMTETDREQTYAAAHGYLKSNGIMIVQDFVSLQSGKLVFSGPGSTKYAYRTFVKDKSQDFERPEELLIWENARCTRVRLGVGQMAINGSQMSVGEAMHRPYQVVSLNSLSETSRL